jgi:hypothetical protein
VSGLGVAPKRSFLRDELRETIECTGKFRDRKMQLPTREMDAPPRIIASGAADALSA